MPPSRCAAPLRDGGNSQLVLKPVSQDEYSTAGARSQLTGPPNGRTKSAVSVTYAWPSGDISALPLCTYARYSGAPGNTMLSANTTACLTPGLCKSNLVRDDESWIAGVIRRMLIGIVARSTEVGSRCLVNAVKPELGEECHGAFLMDCKPCADLTGNSNKPEMKEARSKFLDELSTRLQGISPGIF